MVGRNSCLFEAFFTGACFPCKMLHEQLWKVLSFTGEVSTTVNLERREHADVRLLITTHADNKHLFDGKATNKDSFEKIAEQFINASGFLVKRRRGACKRMGLVTNGTLFSQTEIPRIPNRNFPKFFVNGKHPHPFTNRFRKIPETSLGNAYRRKTCSIWHTRPIHPRLLSPSDVFPTKIQNGGTTVIVERNARLLFGRRASL